MIKAIKEIKVQLGHPDPKEFKVYLEKLVNLEKRAKLERLEVEGIKEKKEILAPRSKRRNRC